MSVQASAKLDGDKLVVQIDEATHQNVPMAEAAAQSARTLEEQGRGLVRSAGVFRLS